MTVFGCILFTSLILSFTWAEKTTYNVISNKNVHEYKIELFGNASIENKWKAEGTAIKSALAEVFKQKTPGVRLRPSQDTHIVVGSVGGNTGTLIAGLIETIDNNLLQCSRIVVVYIPNYTIEKPFESEEYKCFEKLLSDLREKATEFLTIEVYRLQPKIFKQTEYLHTKYLKEVPNEELPMEVPIDSDSIVAEIIDENDLTWLIQDPRVTVLLDGIVGSGRKDITINNQHIIAVSRAHIRVMSRAIRIRKASIGNLLVIVNDSPSGMSESGKWECGGGYKVDFILSSGWNKPLVNELHILYNTTVIVLDISYNNKRFVKIMLEDIQNHDTPLGRNIVDAEKIPATHGFFTFRKSRNVKHNYFVPKI